MNHPEIVLVLARAANGTIGKDGGMPWHIPADLRHFKQVTKGRPMIMGRKTFDSLPGLLDGRRHIVLTRDQNWEEEGAEVVHSVEEALKRANGPHVCVIGGAEIYSLFRHWRTALNSPKLRPAPMETLSSLPLTCRSGKKSRGRAMLRKAVRPLMIL